VSSHIEIAAAGFYAGRMSVTQPSASKQQYVNHSYLVVLQLMYFIVEVLTEDVLVAHEQELSRLRSYYEQHKDLLEKVERWKKLWAQFLEFEVSYWVVN